MQFLQLNYNYVSTTTMDFVCNYNDNVMLMLLSIDLSKFDMWHYGNFLGIFFKKNIDLHHPL